MASAIFIIIVTTLFAVIDSKRNRSTGLIIAFIIITIFAGLRYGYGSDYFEYLRNFEYLSGSTFSDDLTFLRVEIGWKYLSIICQPIGFFGMVIVLAIVEYFLISRFIIRYVSCGYHWVAILCFTLNANLMLLGFSMMRQFLAMCIILFSTDFIVQKKWLIAVAIVALASLFHTSALLCLPICFAGLFNFTEWKKTTILIYGLIIVVLYLTVAFVFSGMVNELMSLEEFSDYGEYYVIAGGENQYSLFSIPRLFELFILFCLLRNFNSYNQEEATIAIIFSFGYLFNGFIGYTSMVARVVLYFSFFGVACIPMVIKYSKSRDFKISFLALYFFYLTYRLIAFFNEPTWSSFLEYHTIIEERWQ